MKKGSDGYKEAVKRRSKDISNWRKRTKQKIIDAMGGCCQICGYNKCNAALELHHIDPSSSHQCTAMLPLVPAPSQPMLNSHTSSLALHSSKPDSYPQLVSL